MATVAEMAVEITAKDNATSVLDKIKGGLGNVVTTAAGFAIGGGLSQLPGQLLSMAQAAADDAASTAQLEQAIKNAEGSFDPYAKQIEDVIKKGQELAFTDDETRGALSILTAQTGDAEEAMKRLTLAQDLARGTGMSLDSAAKLLGKTSDENLNTFKKYGIQLDENATAQDVLNAVDAKFGGQAGAFAESDAAKMQIMADKVGELQEQIGYKLLPVMAALVGVAITVIDTISTGINPAFSFMQGILESVGGFIQANAIPIIAGLSAAILTLAIAALPAMIAAAMTFVTTTAPALIAQGIAIAIAYAPITLTVLAVAAAVALLAYAWENNLLGIQDKAKAFGEWIAPYISTVFGAISTAVTTVLDAIQLAFDTVFPTVQGIVETVMPIIGGVIDFYLLAWQTIFTTAFGIIQAVFETVFPIVQGIVETVMPIIHTVVSTYIELISTVISTYLGIVQTTFETIWGAIKGITSAAWSGADSIYGYVDTGINAVKSKIDEVLGLLQTAWDTFWNGIKTSINTVWNGADGIYTVSKNAIEEVKSSISTALDGLKTKWDTIWSGLSTAVSEAWGDIKGYINSIIGGINALISGWNNLSFSSPGKEVAGVTVIPSFTFDTPNVPLIPMLARGGIVTAPTLAMVGDSGPEAVIPLNETSMRQAGFSNSGDGTTIIELHVDGELLEQIVTKRQARKERMRVSLGFR